MPVIELGHLTDDQKKAYLIAHNKIATRAGWDYKLLQLELNTLKLNLNLEPIKLGFSLDELDVIMQSDWAPRKTDEGELGGEQRGSADPKPNFVALNDGQYDVFKQVVSLIKQEHGADDMTEGDVLELICRDYLGSK